MIRKTLCLLVVCALPALAANETVVPLAIRTADGIVFPSLVLKPTGATTYSVEVQVLGGAFVGQAELVGDPKAEVQRIVISRLRPSEDQPPHPGFVPTRIQLQVKGDRVKAAFFGGSNVPMGRGKGKAYTRTPEMRSTLLTTPQLPYRQFANATMMTQALALYQVVEQIHEGVHPERVLASMESKRSTYPLFAPVIRSLRWGVENGKLNSVVRDLELSIGSKKP